ncbi:uncharacterized protein AKAME5_001987600 [Lates japonicus]|uniref:Uncharacterized protein n=1 Tax=Lates japonicus TaxID=270547 RepID=A0AAD3N8J2_LATJO|nr:uncharacterized protein AKAME5_001987600 [Lates japonicus]
MQPMPGSHGQNWRGEREINYCLCFCLKQAMSKTIYKRRTKGAGGPSNSQTSGDRAESILSRALTHSHHCHQRKIGWPLSHLKMGSSHFMCNQAYISD